ncbi:MAG: MFS transporter [Myxococcales bacterium]|nr:MFS transporter [Myxococcales bacterium]
MSLSEPLSPEFQRRRVQNWVFLGLMYAMFYMGRYNFSAVNALLADKFGWSNADLASIIFAGKITYGISVFINGPFADRIGGKKAILLGAVGATLFNFAFGMGSLFLVKDAVWNGKVLVQPAELASGMTMSTVLASFSVMWALNHYFQSFGALSIVKINAAWFRVPERGSFAGIFGIMIQSGRTLAFAVGPLIAGALPWQWVFWVPALCLVILFGLNYMLVEDTPADAGFPDLDTGDETVAEKEQPVSLKFVLRKVFTSSAAWTIAASSMMIGFVRNGVDDWWAKYFVNVQGAQAMQSKAMIPYNIGALVLSVLIILGILRVKRQVDSIAHWSPFKRFGASFGLVGVVFVLVGFGVQGLMTGMDTQTSASLCFQLASVGMPIAAVFGGLVSGNASDALFQSRRAPVICFAFIGMAVVGTIHSVVNGGPFFAAWMLIGLSFFIQAAHSMVGGAASMDFGGRKAVATAAGLFDGAQYLAGAVVALFIGKLVDKHGWGVWAWTYVPFALIGALLIARLWNVRPGRGGH